MTIYKAARTAALMAGASMLLAASPSLAQRAPRNQQAAPARPQGQDPQQQALLARFQKMSRAEQQALMPLVQAGIAALQAQSAGQPPNWAAVQAALPAAEAAARSNEAKFFIARAQLELAIGNDNAAGQEAALTALLSNPVVSPAEQAIFRNAIGIVLNKRAETAFQAQDYATAERIYRQLLQGAPNDERLLRNIRIIQERSGNTAGAAQSLQQQIQSAEASGQRAPEDLYQRAWQVHYRGGQRAQAMAGLQKLLKAYPTAANWRRGLDVVREGLPQNDNQALIDAYRFARAANIIQPREYLSLATTLDQAGLPGETKAVLDAGIAAGAVQASQADVARLLGVANRRIGEDRAGLPAQIRQAQSASGGRQARITADVLFGYGRYAEAAELYRLALTKGGEDANLVNTRLGAALALAGQRAAAETALRAVTGNRADLAALWLAWLGRSQS
ncbi:MAG TPA: hypothetical protein VEZ41_14165 [Allosphingosinicella sp.]|nr:hypothetical protein [Allosphingosinicella sp.]